MKTAVMTDTNSNLTVSKGSEEGIFVLPMPLLIEGKSYLEGEDITPEEVCRKIDQGVEVVTSQPSPEVLIDMFDMILGEKGYDELVYIPMSSALSSSYETAVSFAREYDGRVQVVDNRRISVSQMCSCLDAVKYVRMGLSAAEIKQRLERDAGRQAIYITLPTVKRLVRTGRITSRGAALAGILNIKPILFIGNQKIDAFARARGMKMAETIMIDAIKKVWKTLFDGVPIQRLRMFVANSYYEEEPREVWRAKVQALFPQFAVQSYVLPASICVHVGSNLEGIGMIEVQ